MELKEALLNRRSIRKFTDEKVSREDIDELLIAAMSGPSACNRCPWEFFVITNEQKLQELKGASRFSNMQAPLAIVVCGNISRALPMQLSTYWIQDCSAAIENILLRVTDLGLGAVWCGLHPQKRAEDRTRKMLDINEKWIPLGLIWIGHPAQSPEPRTQFDLKRVHFVE